MSMAKVTRPFAREVSTATEGLGVAIGVLRDITEGDTFSATVDGVEYEVRPKVANDPNTATTKTGNPIFIEGSGRPVGRVKILKHAIRPEGDSIILDRPDPTIIKKPKYAAGGYVQPGGGLLGVRGSGTLVSSPGISEYLINTATPISA